MDDEKQTQDGLMRAVEWKTLGNENVVQAGDGIQGCELAAVFRPEKLPCILMGEGKSGGSVKKSA